MAKLFAPNLDSKGRRLRAILGSILLQAGTIVVFWNLRAALVVWGCAAFVLFEAARGCCAVRACGIKTRI
jgi:flagellar motor component MotA